MPKIVPTKPLLIMMYGFPGAGKTYFARQLCNELQAAHLQGDRVRSELFEEPRYDREENSVVTHLMDYMTEEFLSAGMSVIYDVNAMRGAKRHELRDMARQHKAHPLLVWIQVDPETSYLRGAKRDRRHIDDKYSRPMDRQTFESVASGMQNPGSLEDYVVISGKHIFSTQFSSLVKRLHELSLIGGNDTASRVVKPGLVNLVPQSHDSSNNHLPPQPPARRNIIIR